MDRLKIRGGKKLKGKVQVSGSKNAALPCLIAAILSEKPVELKRVPDLADIETTIKLLSMMGVQVSRGFNQGKPNQCLINASTLNKFEAPYDLVRKMRASVIVLGPLLARYGRARVSLPGGCAIGNRPIDLHLKGLERLGAKLELTGGYVEAKANGDRLVGDRVTFEFPSVGATENVMMAATLAKGESVLENAAREPEIIDLAEMLNAIGAKVEGQGTSTIRIQGVEQLRGGTHEIMGDRIEAGTFLSAALATGGDVTVQGMGSEHIEAVLEKLANAGGRIERHPNAVRLIATERPLATDISTLPFPGFPTDMQAQFMAAMLLADGACVITENIFENRFMHVPELNRLGADIVVKGKSAMIKGVKELRGAPLMATDLRASASLVIAGLCAEGETLVNRIYHLDRGYEAIEEKLVALGADIVRESTG